MRKHGWSLRWLIGGIYFFIMVLLLGPLAYYFSHWTEQLYLDTVTSAVLGQARLGAEILAPLVRDAKNTQALQKNTLPALHLINARAVRTVRQVTLLALDGSVIADTMGVRKPATNRPPPEVRWSLDPGNTENGFGKDIRFNAESDERILYIAVPVQFKRDLPHLPGQRHWPRETVCKAVLVLAAPLGVLQDKIKQINIIIGIIFIFVLLLLLFINDRVSFYLVRPLAALSEAAERFAGGALEQHVPSTGAAEVASLGASFNRMADKLRSTITNLAEERAQAEAILASMVDGVLVTDNEGKVLLMNQSAEEVCGLASNSVVDRMLAEAVPQEALPEMLATAMTAALPIKQELTFTGATEHIVEVHMAPVEIDERQVGVVIVLYDITAQRKMENAQKEFVANVSHELRTPVASIRAMAEALIGGGCDEPEITTDFLQTIAGETERLTALLDGLLQLSRLESGRQPISTREFDLGSIVQRITQRIIAPLTAHGQHLEVNVPEHLLVVADPDALVQILVNLLDNARKYSPDGGTINLSAERDEMLRVRVSDQGMGIPAEELERIFERFYRVDKARSRAQGGTGLGLSIVRHLVELHGGRVFAESELGVGTCMTVVLPQPEGE